MHNLFEIAPEYTEIVLEEMLLLVKYGNFSREDIINMPVWERKFHLRKLIEYNNKKS